MELDELQKHWDRFAETDPLWAILTHADKRGNRWGKEEFFETGRQEIRDILDQVLSLPFRFRPSPSEAPPQARHGHALDFGCGVGRLTQAMCLSLEECHGVDIAPAMIAAARRFNCHPGRCHYHLNEEPDLLLFESESFDFVYSNIVLQHMEPRYGESYIREFVRVLKPGGALVFQVPSECTGPMVNGTRIERPLEPDAFSARITCRQASLAVTAGRLLELPVRVRNQSPRTWPARGPHAERFEIHLGNHWLDRAGRMVCHDDVRAVLPEDIGPGQELEIMFQAEVYLAPGEYILELDLVQEQVAWFAGKGSRTLRVPVRVEPPLSAAREAASSPTKGEFRPKMEMYAIAKARVLQILADEGATTLKAEECGAAPDWRSFRYFVTKH